MTRFIQSSGACWYTRLLFICFLTAMLFLPVAGADANIEAELGDTLNLHGVSYMGGSVYLFMTGPGLMENGVTLTDVTQRADQGQFTRIDLDSNQEWSYRWNTARIENEINAGTYMVYVTTEPVDKSHLGGSNTYKTLEVYLKESTTPRISSDSGTYTLNPEDHSSVPAPTLAITLMTPPTPTPTANVTTVSMTTPTPISLPTTKSPLPPATVFLALLMVAGVIILYRE